MGNQQPIRTNYQLGQKKYADLLFLYSWLQLQRVHGTRMGEK